MYRVVCSCGTEFGTFDPGERRCMTCRTSYDDLRDRYKSFFDPYRPDPRTRGYGPHTSGMFKKEQPEQIIPIDMLRRLIMLCHPDKHNNSEMSRIATDWLLKLKEKQ